MKKAVIAVLSTTEQADAIVSQLQTAGFASNDISVLYPDKAGTKAFAHTHNTKAPEGATLGAGTGGVLGGAVGLLAGIGALAIPGLGPFIAAGPIMAALSGAAVGAAGGGVVGALVGMGIPEYEAKLYEGRLRAGNLLVAVHTETSEEQTRARELFKRAGVEDIASKSEAKVPSEQTKTTR